MSISSPFLDLKKFQKLEKIEEGNSNEVYTVTLNNEQELYYAKIFFKDTSNKTKKSLNSLKNSKNEINVLSRNIITFSKLRHPSITHFFGFSLTDFENQPNPVVITEYPINNTLKSILDYQRQSKIFSTWDDTKKLINIYGIASGMSYLHSRDITHGDLNTKNILMDEFLCPKIDNYYLSKLNLQNSSNKGKKSANKNFKAVDIYSFSLIVYEIMTNEIPVQGEELIINDDSIPKCYQKLINQCSTQEPSKRLTFDKIVDLLKTDSSFITENVEKNDFFDYVKFIDNYQKTYISTRQIIELKDFASPTSQTYMEVNIEQLLNQPVANKRVTFSFPKEAFGSLDFKCQELVKQADEGDAEKQFFVGKCIFEGSNDFPQNEEIGIEYLVEAIRSGSVESAFYYCQIIIDRKLYQQDLEDIEEILSPLLIEENVRLLTLFGQIEKKGNHFSEAEKYFKKAADAGDAEAMYKYGKLLFKTAKEYLEKSKLKGYQKSDDFLMKQFKKDESYQQTLLTTGIEDFVESEIKPQQSEDDKNNQDSKMISMNSELESSFRLTKAERNAINKAKETRHLKQAATNGDVEAMVRYGVALMNGDGVQKDQRMACHFFKRASEEGNSEAMLQYGKMLEQGNGIPVNKRKACRYYRIAADKGNAEAMNYYGLMLLNGEGIEVDQRDLFRYNVIRSRSNNLNRKEFETVDKRKACHYFKAAADKGNVDAMLNYGKMLSKGNGVPIDKEESCRYFKEAADNGNTEAMMIYSALLTKGEGVAVDEEEACRYCKMAADSGNFKAMYDYGVMLLEGRGVEKDKAESSKYLRMAAEGGNANAMLQFGLMLSKGDGVPLNKEAAVYFFRLSANKRNVEAMRNYGLMLAKGEGVSMDKKKACFYLKKAADRGNVEAMLNYGLMAKKGDGVPVSKQEACKYFKQAADKGNVKAMLNYGMMLFRGEGVAVNKKKASLYIRNAAYKGNVKAMLQYAMMLENGEGVMINKDEAQYYYKMAADKGNIEADVYYNIVSEEMQSELLLSEQLSEH